MNQLLVKYCIHREFDTAARPKIGQLLELKYKHRSFIVSRTLRKLVGREENFEIC